VLELGETQIDLVNAGRQAVEPVLEHLLALIPVPHLIRRP